MVFTGLVSGNTLLDKSVKKIVASQMLYCLEIGTYNTHPYVSLTSNMLNYFENYGKIYLHFLSFLDTKMVQDVYMFWDGRQGIIYYR